MMNKIIVAGCPGSGKSTFASLLSKITDISVYTSDDKDFKWESVRDDRWIIEGVDLSIMEKCIKDCDCIYFMDIPYKTCFDNIRLKTSSLSASAVEEVKEYINDFAYRGRKEMLKLMMLYPEKEMHIFMNYQESNNYIDRIKKDRDVQLRLA